VRRLSSSSRIALVVAAAFASASCAGDAVAAASPWVVKANAVCRVWEKRAPAAVGANPNPRTPAQMYAFMVKARPFEVGLVKALKNISLPRPPGAAHALALATADVHELDTALAAHRAGSEKIFLSHAFAWLTDQRANKAFRAIGARACSS
jgi:hypothetical protein